MPTTDPDSPIRRCACLLRAWQEGDADARTWRFSLQDTESGERRGFADLESLAAALRFWLAAGAAPAADTADLAEPYT